MLEALHNYLVGRSLTHLLRDLLDIFLVYYFFYRLLLVATDRVTGRSKLSRRIMAEAMIVVWRLRFSH